MKSRGQGRVLSAPREQQRRARAGGRRATTRPRTDVKAAEKAFRRRYPEIAVDPELFKLVGVDPPLNLHAEREALREAVADRFATK